MFPGVNQKQMQQMMKKMGMSQEEIEASEVIIKLPDRKLVISNPQVSKVNMMGQETYQVVGSPVEQALDDEQITINDDDIQTVVDQTGASKEDAKQAIEDANGDLAEAILALQKE